MRFRPSSAVRSLIFDIAVGAGATFIGLGIAISLTQALTESGRFLVLGLLTIHTSSLVFRRSFPWATFAVNLVTGFLIVALGMPPVVMHFSPLIALYSVASRADRRRSLWALGASVSSFFVLSAISGWKEDVSTVAGNAVALAAAWAGGNLVYGRQLYVERLEARTRELEGAREELAQKVVSEERLRIARELHDVVAHSLSVIAVQSGVGAHIIEQDPGEARRSLEAIEHASRKALREMRGLLTVLRDEKTADKVPLPGVEMIPSLVEQVSASGPVVELQILGEPRQVDPGLSLTAYRIVQESLTNVLKHAGARSCRVVLSYREDELVVDIVDDGGAQRPSSGAEGHGMVGMRERAEMHGGSFNAGPLRQGGWGVSALLPIEKRP